MLQKIKHPIYSYAYITDSNRMQWDVRKHQHKRNTFVLIYRIMRPEQMPGYLNLALISEQRNKLFSSRAEATAYIKILINNF